MSALAQLTAEVDSASDALEDTIRRIERRHREDAMWFTGGLHDPHGYVTMAHKDRGALLERLRPGKQSSVANIRAWMTANGFADLLISTNPPRLIINSCVSVPKDAWDWLMGNGPDDVGKQFGEGIKLDHRNVPLGGAFWWRSTFRRMCGL